MAKTAKTAKSTTPRDWFDLHPKVAAALATFVALLGLVFVAAAVGVDLREDVKAFIVGGLVVLAGYLKSGD